MPDPYVSEVKYLGSPTLDFIEIAVDAGTDVSDIFVTVYNSNGSVRSVSPLGTLVTTEFGKDIYVIDTATAPSFNGLHKFGGIALEQGGSLLSFVSFDDGAPITATQGIAAGSTSTQIGGAGSGESLETTDGGTTYVTQTSPTSGSIPCLCAGSLIATETGPVAIEALRPGMKVLNSGGAGIALKWIFGRQVRASELRRMPNLRPVRIQAGALGDGLPQRDLLVSRQHRMVLRSAIAERMFKTPEVFVPAIKLTSLPGIFVDHSVTDVTYFHLLFEGHHVILAEGAPTESLYVGENALRAIAPEARAEIARLFPDLLGTARTNTPARLIPSPRLQKRLLMRHAKNRRPLLMRA